MNKLVCVVLVMSSWLCAWSQQQPQEQKPQQPVAKADVDAPVFREPFTLKLHVDKEHYYEEHYDRRIPYVADNDIYLFSGEDFGVSLIVTGDEVTGVKYQCDPKKADVYFAFKQEKREGGEWMMMLITQNKTKHTLRMDALMTVPGKEGIYKTIIVPIEAGLSSYEMWPHPIVQLVLRNFRFSEKPPAAQQQKGKQAK